MLAFAFLATFGFNGLVTVFLEDVLGVDLLSGGTWLYGLTGLAVVYTYFQIPLMVIVFLPALDGRPAGVVRSVRQPRWLELVVLAECRRPDPGSELPRCDPAVVRERVLRLRHRGRARQPGQPDRAVADQQLAVERCHPRAGEPRQSACPGDDRHRRDRHVSVRGSAAAGIALASMTAKAATAAKPPKRHWRRSSARWADPAAGRRLPAAPARGHARVLHARCPLGHDRSMPGWR